MLYKMSQDNILPFITAGKAVVTLESQVTGVRYTYRIKNKDDLYFVALLTGPDNTQNYTYIGMFTDTLYFRTTKASKLPITSKPCIAFSFFLEHIHDVPTGLNVYHSSHCGRCGRKLTVPESIVSGIGPECAKKSFA